MYNITNVLTIRYKWTASGDIINSALDYKFMGPVNILRLQRRKTGKKRQIQKTLSEKSVERKAIKYEIFSRKFSIFNYFLKATKWYSFLSI